MEEASSARDGEVVTVELERVSASSVPLALNCYGTGTQGLWQRIHLRTC